MFIQTESTPNPKTIKFLPDHSLSPDRQESLSRETAARSPLAARLFEAVPSVTNVFIGEDFLSVSVENEADWSDVQPKVLKTFSDFLESGDALWSEEAESSEGEASPENIASRIEALIDARIRPAVARDGGDIVFCSYEDGVVTLDMQGACSGCPHAVVTLREGVARVLKHYFPEIRDVRRLNEEQS